MLTTMVGVLKTALWYLLVGIAVGAGAVVLIYMGIKVQ